MRRRIAACLLAFVSLSFASPATCRGWKERADERMACCQRAAHDHSDDQRAADQCCAGGEQRDQPGTQTTGADPAPLLHLPALASTSFDALPSGLTTVRHTDWCMTPQASPPGFFGPPLRI